MAGKKKFDEQEALGMALDVFWDKGYASTSLTDLTTGLGISKGSFYATYKGKRAIFDRTLELYSTTNIRGAEAFLKSETDVKIGLRKLFYLNIERAYSDPKRRGCFIANTCAELAARDKNARLIVDNHNGRIQSIIYDYLRKGQLNRDKDLKGIANLANTLLNGINVEVKSNKNKVQFLKSVDLLISLLD